ncbi:crossover junction endodeoxyribonuclease RuvC [Micromonospora matsumotoense]|uniref:crossover junction endodeoxyribonuclease RuvC n=1 Tax=Micromonospora matsumotoense TaxID=121616 RepID=UPI00342F89E9
MAELRMVALDLSLAATGLAATHDHHGQPGLLARTVHTARTARGATDMDHARVDAVLRDVAAATKCRPHLVVVEWLPSYDGKGATSLRLAELHGVIKHWLHHQRIAYVDVHPPEVKIWATGNGNANKGQVLEAVTATYGRLVHVDGHDQADAVSLLSMGMAAYGQPLAGVSRPQQRRALENVRWPTLATEAGPVVPTVPGGAR